MHDSANGERKGRLQPKNFPPSLIIAQFTINATSLCGCPVVVTIAAGVYDRVSSTIGQVAKLHDDTYDGNADYKNRKVATTAVAILFSTLA